MIVQDVEVKAAIAMHDMRDPNTLHDDLQASTCCCRQQKAVARVSVADGPPCLSCGDLTFRSGSCYSCHTCGSTTGCG